MKPLNKKIEFWKETYVDDGFGSGEVVNSMVLSTKCSLEESTRTSPSQTQAGSFDFYQVYNFIIRDRIGFIITTDMIAKHNGGEYVIHGWIPLQDNPKYIKITTSIKR